MPGATYLERLRGKNLRHILAFLRAKLTVDRILKTVDLKRFETYQVRYRDADPPPHGYSKYLDIRHWMADKLMYVYMLGLHESKPIQILDLGTGPGYFPYICSLCGHQVVGLDLGDVPMYNELCEFLKVDIKIWRIEKFQKLPDFGIKFDLVTAFMIKFNQHYMPDQWGVAEWKFMIEDLRKNQLTETGRIFLKFNANLDGSYYDKTILNYFLSLGARVYRDQADIGDSKERRYSD